ncbi:hypothetical protein DVH24_010259, partial [Malus domestica]
IQTDKGNSKNNKQHNRRFNRDRDPTVCLASAIERKQKVRSFLVLLVLGRWRAVEAFELELQGVGRRRAERWARVGRRKRSSGINERERSSKVSSISVNLGYPQRPVRYQYLPILTLLWFSL